MLQQAKEKETELLSLLRLTPIEMWQTDLDAFLAQWKVCQLILPKQFRGNRHTLSSKRVRTGRLNSVPLKERLGTRRARRSRLSSASRSPRPRTTLMMTSNPTSPPRSQRKPPKRRNLSRLRNQLRPSRPPRKTPSSTRVMTRSFHLPRSALPQRRRRPPRRWRTIPTLR